MTHRVARAVAWDSPPTGLDTIAHDLRAMRSAAGEPSYAEIGRRVADRRAARGVPEHERRIPRTTLFNCFRDGRRRIDVDAVTEIALALGLPDAELARWSERLRLARAAADGAAVAVVRDQVPAPVPYFAGRAEELGQLATRLEAGPVWVSGMAGAGKTQLVLQLARSTSSRAQFLDLRGHHAESPPVEPAAAQRAILRSLDADEGGEDTDRAARIAHLLRASGGLLVLDDAAGPEQVEAIVGPADAGRVVVTSRTPLGQVPGWKHVPLHGLGRGDAVEVLAAMADGAATIEDGGAAVERLVAVTGGLPLAVALVGGRLATHRDWTLAEHVDLIAARLESGRVDADLRLELDLSYADLSPGACRLLRAFADLPVAELGRDEVRVLVDDDPDTILHELAAAGLVVLRDEGRFALHSLVRAYGRERAEETDPPRARDATFARLGQFLAERVWAAYRTIAEDMNDSPRRTNFPFPDVGWSADEAHAWLRTRLAALLTVAHAAPERGHQQLLFRVSEGLSWWLNLSGNYSDALRLHEAAADLAAEIGDADALAMASLDAGQLLVMSDRPEEARAHFARATRLIADVDELWDPGLAGVIDNMSALLDMREGRLDDAIAMLHRASTLHEARGEMARLSSTLVNLGVALHTKGAFEKEAEVIERGLAHAEASGNPLFQANFLVNRGDLRIKLDQLDDAVADAERAIRLAAETGIPYIEAAALSTIAEAHRRRGELDEAARWAAIAIDKARRMGAMVISQVLLVAAAIEADRGDHRRVLAMLEESERNLSPSGDHVLRGHAWRLRGEIADDPTERAECFANAVAQFDHVGYFLAEDLRPLSTG